MIVFRGTIETIERINRHLNRIGDEYLALDTYTEGADAYIFIDGMEMTPEKLRDSIWEEMDTDAIEIVPMCFECGLYVECECEDGPTYISGDPILSVCIIYGSTRQVIIEHLYHTHTYLNPSILRLNNLVEILKNPDVSFWGNDIQLLYSREGW